MVVLVLKQLAPDDPNEFQCFQKQFLCGLFFVFLTVIFCAKFAYAADLKIAYVDIGKVFDEYEKTKKYDQELQEAGKGKQEKRDAIVYEVRRLRDEQALLSEDKKKETQGAIESKLKELEDFDGQAQKELSEKRNGVMKEVFTDIEDVVKRFGERKGYDLIFNERALLFKSVKYDVTNDILNELNKEYAKKKK